MSYISDYLNFTKIEYITDYKLSRMSTFKIGGPADFVLFPKNITELVSAIKLAKENNIRFEIIGNGSNILFSDDGYNGLIITTKKMDECTITDNTITALCGVKLSTISKLAKDNSLSGLEFACGIPGTLGGAVAMNAGAYGSQMSDIVFTSTLFDTSDNKFWDLSVQENKFDYRTSIYSENKNSVCLSATLKLERSSKSEIERKMKENTESRRQHQPLDMPNCGSFFRRPNGFFAAKLIDDCNLKGVSVGGAQVSVKHAGFIVNTGNATSKDVLKLAEIIRATVKDKFGVVLENEVKYIY